MGSVCEKTLYTGTDKCQGPETEEYMWYLVRMYVTWGLGDVFHFALHLLGLEVHSPQARVLSLYGSG